MLAKSYDHLLVIVLLTINVVLAGCGGSGTTTSANGQGSISAKLVWYGDKTTSKSVANAPAGVTTVRVIISGTGYTTKLQDFPAANGSGIVSGVPVGNSLTVTASGLDASGAITYQGSVNNITVQPGQTTDIGSVTMLPMYPPTGSSVLTARADLPRRLPIFRQPFNGFFLNSAPFDHDLPLSFDGGGNNDYILTWWGGHIYGIWNGHSGNDWLLPIGTPVLAAADGEVTFAEAEPPFLCGDLGMVSALVVVVKHVAPDAEIFDSLYVHLNRIDVNKGEPVVAGQQLGVSGMTGCTNGAHLHFEVVRRSDTNNGKPVSIDPFGWDPDWPDPWEQHPDGARSVWLWKDGEAPEGGKRIEEVWGPGILR